ncbi:aspartate/glutamate racemase family protein [Modicisalibacter luteus]|uniref:Aspartate/glutamate racemase family protein n=1 Tax=Modicisalibacter luteus TaxID=453962 RepID=A0ABV7LZ06_9GAMM|nr:aspartate/glutamate racemase family protein [Halomonas lutea]GHA95987.1 aspartate racemase [Halomonas lutea]
MKTIGILGGMSWESTQSYYRGLNEGVRDRLGGYHSASICLISVDFAEVEALQRAGDWDAAGRYLASSARQAQAAGADFLLIATNTMHRVADAIEATIDIPLLHIADATGLALQRDGLRRIGLLGTRFTMEQAFYRDRIQSRFGIEVITPQREDRDFIHEVIFNELVHGKVVGASRDRFLSIINDLAQRGAEGVILGCTEIGMLVQPPDTTVGLYDTTTLHVAAALDMALNEK